ncbi:MAG: T9SS type A sorting domain-containing protein [candidate division Zixibacteria bacterium]|nr:T9SS type A sorting domain-containing protein [candidate division Zixibacteria bacterium]
MSRKNFILSLIIMAVMIAAVSFLAIFNNNNFISPESFKEYKMSKRSGDTSKKPTDWFTISRAYPYRDIPFGSYKGALDRAIAVRNSTASLDIFDCEPAGPYNVGGRITGMAAHPDRPGLIYTGAALGGVFKSEDAGNSWACISDDVPSLSVGDIAIDPNDPDVLYFGTGEANSSGDSYAGTGIYSTNNGGLSWEFLGLPESRHIGRIAIDPTNTDRIFVAAMGALFNTNPERGIYRTTNAGESWQQVLYVSDSTGAIDVVINPIDPNIIYAAMWERIRGPEDRRVGGLNSGIWRSTDGGDNWDRLTNGLPAPSPNNGRIGLALSPSNPDIIYASYVNHPGHLMGFWRSTDGGDSWQSRLVSPGTGEFSPFGWYFGQIWVHPTNSNIVYFGDVDMWKSVDGGAHWSDISGSMHVDMHALYQDPNNPNYMINGNDGGVFISQNGGNAWYKVYDLPITQFYAITIDKLNPYRLYGGTQDNSTPRTLGGDLDDWDVIFYGDGFYTNIDFNNSNIIYAEAQYGYLGKSTNLGNNWNMITYGIDYNERTNWNTPVVMSQLNSQVLYYGAQRVYMTTNGGDYWNAISPDLTGGPGGGNLLFGTITTISPSPLSSDIIWAGTDDSRVWVTNNNGGSWNMVSDELPQRWCTRVTADVFDSAAAYVTFSGYKLGELMPHIFKTTDYGSTWSDISGNLEGVPVNDILPDPERPGWLYIGTDFGMYYSDDGGVAWQTMNPDHPICPVFDIDLHNSERILVSGTHGRSMYKFYLDDVGIEETDAKPHNYKLGQNYPNPFNASTVISFEAKKTGHVSLIIYDINGRLVSTLVDRVVSAGKHTAVFNASKLASGIYFASLKAGDYRGSVKMSLVK